MHFLTQMLKNNVTAVYQQAAQVTPTQLPAAPPQLWGSDRIKYDENDPIYKRWGLRAAPPYHTFDPPPPDASFKPYWMYLERMKEEKLMLAPQVNMPPPSIMPNFGQP